MRTCRACVQTKDQKAFAYKQKVRGNRDTMCIDCRKAEKAAKRTQRKDEARLALRGVIPKQKLCLGCGVERHEAQFAINARNADGLQDHCRSCHTVYATRSRCAKNGVPFTITAKDLGPEPLNCPCCNVEMVRGEGRECAPSIDKLVPEIGYVPGNVSWLCVRCNRLKNNATVEDLEKILRYMKDRGCTSNPLCVV